MQKSRSARAALFAALAATSIFVPAAFVVARAQDGGAPLIPRSEIFGNPDKTNPQISPDGKWIAYLAPKDGVLNVWVAPVGKMDEAKVITDSKDRPIRQMRALDVEFAALRHTRIHVGNRDAAAPADQVGG